jgi:hypothetical protein
VDLTWQPVEGATGYVVYRALRGHAYSVLATVGPEVLSFADVFTEHGRSYRYAVAAHGVDGGIGLESRPAFAVADERGPHVLRLTPLRHATGVDPRVVIAVRYDENVDPESTTGDTIEVFRGRRRIPGTFVLAERRLLTFDPFGRLDKGVTYTVRVASVRDSLGNLGPRASWEFTTVEPPPPPPPKKPRRG